MVDSAKWTLVFIEILCIVFSFISGIHAILLFYYAVQALWTTEIRECEFLMFMVQACTTCLHVIFNVYLRITSHCDVTYHIARGLYEL